MNRDFASKNKSVIKERNRAQYLKNVEKRKEYQRGLRAANPELVREQDRKRREGNLDHHKAVRRAQYAADPDRFRNESNRRRAARVGATFEAVDRSVVWARDAGLCHLCGSLANELDWHLEHIVPLARGGSHSYRNTAVSHPSCNESKGDRYVPSVLNLRGAFVARPVNCW